ncbi:MAG: phosphatase PAP2 family protein [Planctomycetota bacterium]|nr:MAG: phosphatase PAP2 family protein [Planctomycetota bacterium]
MLVIDSFEGIVSRQQFVIGTMAFLFQVPKLLRINQSRRNSCRGLLLASGMLAIMGGAAFVIDVPVARWFKTGGMPGDVAKIFYLAEVMAHGVGVLGVIVTILVLDTSTRKNALRIVCVVFAGGLASNLIKLMVLRVRPRAIDFSQTDSIWQTFVNTHNLHGSDIASFPSGHAATAAGIAAFLVSQYPRGRVWFLILCTIASLQRLVSSAHYPSDILLGSSLGFLFAAVVSLCWPLQELQTSTSR